MQQALQGRFDVLDAVALVPLNIVEGHLGVWWGMAWRPPRRWPRHGTRPAAPHLGNCRPMRTRCMNVKYMRV